MRRILDLSILSKLLLLTIELTGRVSAFICHVGQFEILFEFDSRADFYVCNIVLAKADGSFRIDSNQYGLELSEDLSSQIKRRIVQKQDTFLSIPGASVNRTTSTITIPDNSQVEVTALTSDVDRRVLQSTRWWENVGGTASVLPIKIRTNDGQQPTYSDDDIYKYLFVDPVSLKWQFHACSFGKFSVEPTDLGILTVDIDVPVGNDNNLLVNKATIAAIQKINQIQGINAQVSDTTTTLVGDTISHDSSDLLQHADLILFITPPMDGWVAFGSVGGRTSVYNDKWGAYLSVHMHEIGHNLLLEHSHELSEYDDYTGAMGGAIVGYHDRLGFPRLCYNAYNNWNLGWYRDRIITLNADNPQIVTIAAFVDYDKTNSNQYVVANVNGQLYMQFNRAKSFNVDTYEYKDQLVIVEKLPDTGTKLVASLNGADKRSYTRSFTTGSRTSTLKIEICSWGVGDNNSPDYLTVSVGLDQSLCSRRRNLKGSIQNSTHGNFEPFAWSLTD